MNHICIGVLALLNCFFSHFDSNSDEYTVVYFQNGTKKESALLNEKKFKKQANDRKRDEFQLIFKMTKTTDLTTLIGL